VRVVLVGGQVADVEPGGFEDELVDAGAIVGGVPAVDLPAEVVGEIECEFLFLAQIITFPFSGAARGPGARA